MENNFNFKVGDIITIVQKIKEGKKERNSSFKGQVVKIKGKDSNRMFTVRQTIEGIDVDKIYPYQLPSIVTVKVVGQLKKKIRRANIKGIKYKKKPSITTK